MHMGCLYHVLEYHILYLEDYTDAVERFLSVTDFVVCVLCTLD
jgi:hypothetical protein